MTPYIGAESGSHAVPEPLRVIGNPMGSAPIEADDDVIDCDTACARAGDATKRCAADRMPPRNAVTTRPDVTARREGPIEYDMKL
jgi:hypothetical protein